MITNLTDCTAFVWPAKTPVPDWLNQTTANNESVVAIVPNLASALSLNATNLVVCFTEQFALDLARCFQ